MAKLRRPPARTSVVPGAAPPVAKRPPPTPARDKARPKKVVTFEPLQEAETGHKGKERAVDVSQSSHATGKRKRKSKTVESSSDAGPSSDSDNGSSSSASASTSSAAASPSQQVSSEDEPPSESDWNDPRSLPSEGPKFSLRSNKVLELAAHRSALHDVAKQGLDLSLVLVEWEAVRRERWAKEQKIQQVARKRLPAEDNVEHEGAEAKGSLDEGVVKMGGRRLSKRQKIKRAEDVALERINWARPYPNLNSQEMADLARWPLHPSDLDVNEVVSLEALVLDAISARQRELNVVVQVAEAGMGVAETAVEPSKSTRPKSAYEVGAPLASFSIVPDATLLNASPDPSDLPQVSLPVPTSNSTASDSDSEDDQDLELEEFLEEIATPAAREICHTIDTLVFRLAHHVPLTTTPSRDWRELRHRSEDKQPLSKAFDWRDVLEMAHRMGTISTEYAA